MSLGLDANGFPMRAPHECQDCPPENKGYWMGEAGQSLYLHKDGGLDGVRCGFHIPWITIRVALSWDSVTCPACLERKEAWEPDTVVIDTRGD